MLRVLGGAAIVLGLVLLAWVNYDALKSVLIPDDESELIAAEARKSVPRPELPPPPEGRVVIEGYDDVWQEIKIPAPTFGNLSRTQTVRTRIARIPKSRAVEPTSEEVQAWKLRTAKMNADYQEALTEKIQEIQQARKKEFREAVESWVKIVGGGISALGGLLTIIVSIKKELPTRPSRGSPRSRKK